MQRSRRAFIGTAMGASLGIGGFAPRAGSGIMLAQSIPDTAALDQINADQERLFRSMVQDGITRERYQQAVSNLRLTAIDARTHDRDTVLKNGTAAVVNQVGRQAILSRMLDAEAQMNAKARELGWNLPVAVPAVDPDGKLTDFMSGDLSYSVVVDDAATALANLYPTIQDRLLAGVGSAAPSTFAGDACGVLQDGGNESMCATFEIFQEVYGAITSMMCAVGGMAGVLSLGTLAAIAAGVCLGGWVGSATMSLISYWHC